MGIKKKLGLGVASAALGLSLVGGGTWAAFNDIETKDNYFAAGTLDLDLADVNGFHSRFNLGNLKPGDYKTIKFNLTNNGSLAIEDVLLTTLATNDDFTNGENEYVDDPEVEDNTYLEFLDQFQVEILRVDPQVQATAEDPNFFLIDVNDNVTLKTLVEGNLPTGVVTTGGKLNLAPDNPNSDKWDGLPANPSETETIEIKIKFKEDSAVGVNGEQDQNKYQGDSIDVTFSMEAQQWEGLEIETDNDGYVNKNEESHSEETADDVPDVQ